MDVVSICFLIWLQIFLYKQQVIIWNSASLCLLNVFKYLPNFSLMFRIDLFITKKKRVKLAHK